MTHNCYNLLKPCLFTYSFTASTLKIWEGHASSWVTLLSNITNNNRKRRATWAYYPPQCSMAVFDHLEKLRLGFCFNILKPSGRHSCLGGYKPIIHLWEKKNPQQHKLFSWDLVYEQSTLNVNPLHQFLCQRVYLCRFVTGMLKSSACSLIVEQRIGIHPWICNYQVYSGAVWILFAWKKEVIRISDLCFRQQFFFL